MAVEPTPESQTRRGAPLFRLEPRPVVSFLYHHKGFPISTGKMPDHGESLHFTCNSSISTDGHLSFTGQPTAPPSGDPLINLSSVKSRMESLHGFLSDSIAGNALLDRRQMDMVSSEISSAIQQVIVNGTALLASLHFPNNPSPENPNFQIPLASKFPDPSSAGNDSNSVEPLDEELVNEEAKIDLDIIEIDSIELLAEHVHFCEICGKGFKRDANLRMHMRAHGDQFKRPEALAKQPPTSSTAVVSSKMTRFSCPFSGCNRNQRHIKFKPLKSVVCVRNHFKRSHCPKMYSCNRCNKKNFSVLSDLKSHLKHCGESKWRCTCGTTFSRKDKLFGHMALFEGHMPAVGVEDDANKGCKRSGAALMEDDQAAVGGMDDLFVDGLLDEFPGFDEKSIQEMFGSSSSPDYAQQFFSI